MNTVQSTVGRGTYASSHPQMDATTSKLPPAADQWQGEIWKPFPGLEHLYDLSSLGRVKDLATGEPVKTYLNKGFEVLSGGVKINGRVVRPAIHRAVALAFVPNPNNYRWAVQKDRRKPITHASNLQWVKQQFTPRKGQLIRYPSLAWSGLRPQHNDSVSVPVNRAYGEYILSRLFSEGRLTKAQLPYTGIVAAEDDSMGPQITPGVEFVATPVSPADYHTLVGQVVAVVIKASRFAFYLGRVKSITADSLCVSRDNSAWSDRIESRSVISSIAKVVSILETTVH
jgi:hypothetical protein